MADLWGAAQRREESRPLAARRRLSFVPRPSIGRSSARCSVHERAVNEQQEDRSSDRSEPGAEVKELVDRVTETERLDDQAADECSCNPNQSRDDETPGIVSG